MNQKGYNIKEWEQQLDKHIINLVGIEGYRLIDNKVVRMTGFIILTGDLLVWDKFGKCYNFRGIDFEGEEKILTLTDFADDADMLLINYESILKERFPNMDIIFPEQS